MSKNGRDNLKGEELFARAAYDVLQDLEVGFGLQTSIVLSRTQRKGVFSIEMKCMLPKAGFGEETISKVVDEWPNARTMSLCAHLYSMGHKLYTMAENALKDRKRPASPW